MIFNNKDKFVFYINNNNDKNQFNQLCNCDQIEKLIKNFDIVAHKLGPALTRANNYRLKVIKKGWQKKKAVKK